MAIEIITDVNGESKEYDTTDWSPENYYNATHYGGPGTVHQGSGGVNPYANDPVMSYIHGWTNELDPATQAALTIGPNNTRDDVIRNLNNLTGIFTGGVNVDNQLFNTNIPSNSITNALANVLTANNAKYFGYAALAIPFLFQRNKWARKLKFPLLYLGSYLSGLGNWTSNSLTKIMPTAVKPVTANPLIGSAVDTAIICALTSKSTYRRARRVYRYARRYYQTRTYRRRPYRYAYSRR